MATFVVLLQLFGAERYVHVDGKRRRLSAEEEGLTCDNMTGRIFGTIWVMINATRMNMHGRRRQDFEPVFD
jgi:hypothetical protein